MRRRGLASRWAIIAAAGGLWLGAGCAAPGPGGGGSSELGDSIEQPAMADTTIDAAHAALTERVITIPGVVGTAIGECQGNPCLKVYLAQDDPDLRKRIPTSVGGWPVDVEVTGEFHPRSPGA